MTTTTKPLNVKTEPWPNRLGLNAIVNRIGFEIWNDGRFVRVERDGSICGFRGTHYLDMRGRVNLDVATDRAKAVMAYTFWTKSRNLWQDCVFGYTVEMVDWPR